MAEESKKMEVPAPHAILPKQVAKAWKEAYAAAFAAAASRFPDDPTLQKQHALAEANALLRVPEPKNYAEAKDLAEWQVIHREEKDGKLNVVTIDGRSYSFDVPSGAAKAEKQK